MYNKAILLVILHLCGQYVQGVKNDTLTCDIGITKESIDEARQKFDGYRDSGMRLVNIYLDSTENVTEIFNKSSLDPKEKNSIVEWIWSSAAATFDLQLPIDIDAATFQMMRLKQDDIDITLELLNDSENCTFNSILTEEKVFDILINSVTTNGVHGDGFLCKRIFENQEIKKLFHYFTAIWIGYDFNCSTVGNNGTVTSTIFKKYPPIATVYAIEIIVVLLYPFTFTFLYFGPYDVHSYQKGEKPYGIERIIRRIFHQKGDNNTCVLLKYVPVLKFTFICYIFILPLVISYGMYFKKSIKNYDKFYEVYKFKESDIYLPLSYLILFNLYLAYFIQIFPNEIWILNTYFFVCSSSTTKTIIKKIDLNDISSYKFDSGLARTLIVRGSVIFSVSFWKTIMSEIFCPPECDCRHILVLPLHILLNLIVLVIDILTCLSPFLWMICRYILLLFCKKRNRLSTFKQYIVDITIGLGLFNFLIVSFYFADGNVVFIFMPIAYITRIITYTLFIAIPTLDAGSFQIFLIVITAGTYTLSFLHSFLEVYKALLDEMFEIRKSAERNPKISEKDFDLVAAKTFPVGAQVGKLLFKIFLMSSGIVMSTSVLIESKHVESSSENLGQLLVIILSPGFFVQLFMTSGEEMIKQKKDQIFEAMNPIRMNDTSSDIDSISINSSECFNSTSFCFCRSNTSVSGESRGDDQL